MAGVLEIMLNALQNTCREGDSTWYALIDQNKELWYGMAEFADHTCSICGMDCFPDNFCV